tara:strand:+ start:165 stop:2765 length:2601 start_codon:yes stop_codon:yes gene_type:complete
MKRLIILSVLLFNLYSSYSQQKESPLVNSFHEHIKLKNQSNIHLDWISLGPVLNSARVESIQVDEKNPGTMYVAFGSGNLWKTVNNGITWKPIFENQPSLGIGDIALAPSNSDIIYVGTGESLKKARNFTMPGTGMYRSTNGGDTWEHIGLEDSWHIGEISVHPTNPDIVLVSVLGHFWSKNVNRGIYKTEDGGKSWKHVLYIDENTGSNDIVISNSNPEVIYASMWENNPGISGLNSGIYKSSDGGDNWEKLINGLPYGKKMGRIGLAVSYSNPNKVYALIDNLSKNRSEAAEVYKTIDGGKLWKRTHEDELMIFPGIGWYFADIYVNPKDDEEIYSLGVRIAKSMDGGKTFNNLYGTVKRINPSDAKFLHLDHCELWINPKNPKHIALGNDGGLFVSYDKGESWMHYNNIPAGEFYDITISNEEPYLIYGGTQDDATVYGPAKEWNNKYSDKWKYLWIDAWDGGDGCVTEVDPIDPSIVYFSMQNGAIRRKNMKTGKSVSIKPKLSKENINALNYNFITPYFISPHDNKTLYHGGNFVMKTIDQGNSWSSISPDLTKSKILEKNSFSAGAIAESSLQKGLLYYGSDKGSFWVSKDDGKNWSENSKNIKDNYIRSIYPSKFSKSRVYMAMSGINYDDLGNYIYISENYGKDWKSIKSNLPNEPANVIIEDLKFENILYAGLYRGVYISFDKGNSWSILGKNLPIVSISDLIIDEKSGDLIAATHGRGIYKLNLNPIHYSIKKGVSVEKNILFPISDITRPLINDTHKEPISSTAEKLSFSFFINKNEKVLTEVYNDKNDLIWRYKFDAKKGFNEFRWDIIYEKNKSDLPYFIHYNKYLPAGKYKLNLKLTNENFEESFNVYEFDN